AVTVGSSAAWSTKLPGARRMSRNVTAEIPSSSGISCRIRRRTYVRMGRRASARSRRTFDVHALVVPEHAVGNDLGTRVAELVAHRNLDLRHRQEHEPVLVDHRVLDLAERAMPCAIVAALSHDAGESVELRLVGVLRGPLLDVPEVREPGGAIDVGGHPG